LHILAVFRPDEDAADGPTCHGVQAEESGITGRQRDEHLIVEIRHLRHTFVLHYSDYIEQFAPDEDLLATRIGAREEILRYRVSDHADTRAFLEFTRVEKAAAGGKEIADVRVGWLGGCN